MNKGIWWLLAVLLIVITLAGGFLAGSTFKLSLARQEASVTLAPDVETTERQAYWFGRYNLAQLVMMSGLGPQMEPMPSRMKQMAQMVELSSEEAAKLMQGMSLVGGVYAGGDPSFSSAGTAMVTGMRWGEAKMDKTLEPAAQAYTLLKLTARNFHLDYHESPPEKFVALMMIPQAQAIVKLLAELRNSEGRFIPRLPDGRLGEARASDQIAVLWGLSSFVLAATDSSHSDYWSQAYTSMMGMMNMGQGPMQMPGMMQMPSSQTSHGMMSLQLDGLDVSQLLNETFHAVHGFLQSPLPVSEKALAIEALGWYIAATGMTPLDQTLQQLATNSLKELANEVAHAEKPSLTDKALAVYGLMEAWRVTGDLSFYTGALQTFQEMEVLWDMKAGVYANTAGAQRHVYDPFTVGAVLAALNAVRWFAIPPESDRATQHFATFFENAVVHSGLMLATGDETLVPQSYKEREHLNHFTDARLPQPRQVGKAPVYAGQVTYENGKWMVTDPHFKTAPAMFLASMSVMLHRAEVDGFIPMDRLHAKMQMMGMPQH
ncbi:hypothetical protein HYR54_08055 [Candidatus Acetothermia bacterium]|nr:hypothetical protein [Candidatus Acetothermia bacterium]